MHLNQTGVRAALQQPQQHELKFCFKGDWQSADSLGLLFSIHGPFIWPQLQGSLTASLWLKVVFCANEKNETEKVHFRRKTKPARTVKTGLFRCWIRSVSSYINLLLISITLFCLCICLKLKMPTHLTPACLTWTSVVTTNKHNRFFAQFVHKLVLHWNGNQWKFEWMWITHTHTHNRFTVDTQKINLCLFTCQIHR